jgi:gag-polypeptide of LTR copia-type
MDETYPNELWMKSDDMYLCKSLVSWTTLKKRLYRLKMKEDMDLRVHICTFNTLMRDVFNAGGRSRKKIKFVCSWHHYQSHIIRL